MTQQRAYAHADLLAPMALDRAARCRALPVYLVDARLNRPVLHRVLRQQRQRLHPERPFQGEIANSPRGAGALREIFECGGMRQAAARGATQCRRLNLRAASRTVHCGASAWYGPVSTISRRAVSFQAYCRPMKMMNSEIHADTPEVSDKNGATAVSTSRNSAAVPKDMCGRDRKSTRLNSSHLGISYAVFC